MHLSVLPARWRRNIEAQGLLSSSLASVALRGMQALLAFGAALVVARWLTAGTYGDYAIALTVMNMTAIFLALGFPLLTLRETARALEVPARRPWLGGLMRVAAAMILALGAGATLIAGLAMWALPASWIADEIRWLLVGAVAAALPLALMRWLGGWLIGFGRVVAGQFGETVLRNGLFIPAVLLLGGVLAAAPDPKLAFALQAAATLAALIVTLWLARRVQLPGHGGGPQFAVRDWLASSVSMAGIGVLHMVLQNLDVLMLGAIRSSAEAGVYHIASRIAQLSGVAMVAVGAVLMPRMARLSAAGDRAGLQHVAVLAARALTLFSAGLLAVLAVFGRPLLDLLGPGFAAGYAALVILLVAQIFNVALGSTGAVLNMSGLERIHLSGVGVGAATNLALNAILIPRFGIEGAAVATGLSILVWNLYLALAVRRRLGIDATVLGRSTREKPLEGGTP